MNLESAIFIASLSGKKINPQISTSKKYKHWLTIKDPRRCTECESYHGKIYYLSEEAKPKPPLHPHCRCYIDNMKSIKAGTATINGINGADWTLMNYKKLPDYYVTEDDLSPLGWRFGDKVSKYVDNKMYANGVYKNNNGHLPKAEGRIWYEADINYSGGKRNSQRILWSNDGLMFVTYDHYETFYEIV